MESPYSVPVHGGRRQWRAERPRDGVPVPPPEPLVPSPLPDGWRVESETGQSHRRDALAPEDGRFQCTPSCPQALGVIVPPAGCLCVEDLCAARPPAVGSPDSP